MVQLIVGKKGEGKTKVLLDKVNAEVKQANGTLVYLDKSRKHMFELNNKVRLIDMSEYDIQNSSWKSPVGKWGYAPFENPPHFPPSYGWRRAFSGAPQKKRDTGICTFCPNALYLKKRRKETCGRIFFLSLYTC